MAWFLVVSRFFLGPVGLVFPFSRGMPLDLYLFLFNISHLAKKKNKFKQRKMKLQVVSNFNLVNNEAKSFRAQTSQE